MNHYTVHIINKSTGAEQHYKEIFGHNFKEALHNSHLDNKAVVVRGAYRVK